jgi:hypothetical protein
MRSSTAFHAAQNAKSLVFSFQAAKSKECVLFITRVNKGFGNFALLFPSG